MTDQHAGISQALTALAYQLDAWASNGLLGESVLAHTPQTDSGHHVASPADPEGESIVLSHGGGELHLQAAPDGSVRVSGGAGGDATLRLEGGSWITPDGEPLSARWLRGLLGTEPTGEREGTL